METGQIPGKLPATVIRQRPLIAAVMAQSLAECAPNSRTAGSWRWVLAGQGPAPVSMTPGTGGPPSAAEVAAETRHGADGSPAECGWPPWRHANDPDPDRQQARRVLRWLTGAADAIPLLDPAAAGTSEPGSTSPGPTTKSARSATGHGTDSPNTETFPATCQRGGPNGRGNGQPSG